MPLFLIRGDPAFSMLRPVREWDHRGGAPVLTPWGEVDFGSDADVDGFIAADCLTMNTNGDGFLVSDFARVALAPLLAQAAEFWPVRVFGRPYWWLNCVAIVNALDRERTDAEWSLVEGEWGSFSWISSTRRLEFKPGELEDAPLLFRIPEYPQGVLFVSDAFCDAVANHHLTGFKFDQVWSLQEGGVIDPAGIGFNGMFDPVSDNEVLAKRQAAQKVIERRIELS